MTIPAAPPDPTATALPAPAPPLAVPDAGFIGLGRDFADLYGAYLESPRAFFYFAFLTYFGSLVANMVTLDSELRPPPRLYTVLLGESAATRKSTALMKVHEFFTSLQRSGGVWEPAVTFGVGSAEGLAAALREPPGGNLLLRLDEFKAFIDKACIKHSVLLPMVSTLFENPEYDNRTKDSNVCVRGAALSLLAACTTGTYEEMFGRQFHDIGFLNRLWLVVDRPARAIAVPSCIPETALTLLRDRVVGRLDDIAKAYHANDRRPVRYVMTAGARALFGTWYATRPDSIFSLRLDTYALRLMLLLAVTADRTAVDEDIAERVLTLLEYQLAARRDCDPIDADSLIAKLEEKLRRSLARGPLKGRDLKKRVHYERSGIWTWSKALENLKRAGELHHEPATDMYGLMESPSAGRAVQPLGPMDVRAGEVRPSPVPTSVPTAKNGNSARRTQ